MNDIAIVRKRGLEELTGLSYSSIRRIADFPAPVQLGPRAIGWQISAVKAWIDSRPRGALAPAVPRVRGKGPGNG